MSVSTRRRALQSIKANRAQHAGLWLDKFLENQQRGTPDSGKGATEVEKDTARHRLMAEATAIALPAAYRSFFARWEAALGDLPGIVLRRHAWATGRVIVGLGNENPSETAITLHHTFGVPYLPGSALKGLAAFYARNYLEDIHWQLDAVGKPGAAYRTLFGDTTLAGTVTFCDAYYVPGSASGDRVLHTDTITVHHQAYYQGSAPPADWDKPIPVPFLSATGAYLVALSGPDKAWVEASLTILTLALEELGIGAKTSSGYGRMRLADIQTAIRTVQPATQPTGARTGSNRPVSDSTQPLANDSTASAGGRQRGVVKNVKESFAFIRPQAGGNDVFVHQSAVPAKNWPLRTGQLVEYALGPGKKPGEVRAKDVVVIG